MRIVICDDELLYRQETVRLCKEYEKEKGNKNFEITLCSSGEELLDIVEDIDIIILDIDLPKLDGIKVKEILNSKNSRAIIIFLTNHQELMQEAFGISVCGFITKPLIKEVFFPLLEKAILLISMNYKIKIDDKNQIKYINSKDILYIESDKVYTKLVTENKYYLVRKSLNQWEKELVPYGFYRIHKSFLVNMDNVIHIGETACLTNKEELKISRSMKKDFNKVYNQHCLKMARYV